MPLLMDMLTLERRAAGATALARRLGVEAVILFIKDPELDMLLPAPGFTQTLQGSAQWREFLANCAHAPHEGSLPWAGAEMPLAAQGWAALDGSVLVLLGGRPDVELAGMVRDLMPLVAKAMASEQASSVAYAKALHILESSSRNQEVASALDQVRVSLEAALHQNRLLAADLERRVAERTAQLEASNKELESFCYSVSHDLRAPLRAIDGFTMALERSGATRLEHEERELLRRVRSAIGRMSILIDDLLSLARLAKKGIKRQPVDVTAVAAALGAGFLKDASSRNISLAIEPGLRAQAEPVLVEIVLKNLLDNAFKFTRTVAGPKIEVGKAAKNGVEVFFIRDNGVGFDMAFVDKLFEVCERLHRIDEFPGHGVGLAIVERIIKRHGGVIWGEGAVGLGATFFFSFGEA